MHGSLHLILANESLRTRQDAARQARLMDSVRRPFSAVAERVVAAHGIPPRAAPRKDSPSLGRQAAASLRGR